MTYENELAAIVESRIGVRMRFLGAADPVLRHVRERVETLALDSEAEFVDRIASSSNLDPEYRLLVRAVTNGQTFFFRDEEQLIALVDHLVERSRSLRGRTMQIWSAACATGEEPYSLAMLALERGIDVRILATDVNDARIEFAREGRYDEFTLRHVPTALRERWFDREGKTFVAKPALRSRIDFVCHNLLAPELPIQIGRPAVWDVILCRNLFIYLAKETVTDVVRRMSVGLAKDGILCLGTAESLRGHDVPLLPVNTGARVAYRHRRDSDVVGPGTLFRREPSVPTLPAVPGVPTSARETPERRALSCLESDRLEEAEDLLRGLVTTMPDRWDLRLCLGHVHLRSHRLARATAEYARAHALADVEPEPSFFVGLAALKADALDDARIALRRSLFLDESNFRTALLLAGVHERQREFGQAVRMLGHARTVALAPRLGEAFRSRVSGISAATISAREATSTIETRLLALQRTIEG